MKSICMNCEKAFKRSISDMKRNGNKGYPYECLMTQDRPEYKRCDDWCPLFREKSK